MALIVQKYGGTSVGDPERIRCVARRVAALQAAGHRVAVVVSAMAGETDRLVRLAREVVASPDERECDVLISTGEQVTIALLSMALKGLDVKARSFTGFQVTIRTDSAFSRARIQSIETAALRESLEEGTVAVVAGFQGIDAEGNITTLGRGGSDTSAVALAAAVRADVCEILTDVEGVYTTDPNIVPGARKIDRVSFDEMLEMASMGAKVLQVRSVLFAKKFGIPIHVRSSLSDSEGTFVTREEDIMEAPVVSGVTYNRNEAKLTISRVPDRPGIAATIFGPISERGIVVDMIIQNVSEEGTTDLTFTVPRGNFATALEILEKTSKEIGARGVSSDEQIAKVSIVGMGMRDHAGVAQKMFQALADDSVNIQMISTSEIKISCVINEKYVELAVRALHEAFRLGDEQTSEEKD